MKEEFKRKTTTLFSINKKNVSLESFTLLKVLGRGAFGKVMLVEEKETGNFLIIYKVHSMISIQIIHKTYIKIN